MMIAKKGTDYPLNKLGWNPLHMASHTGNSAAVAALLATNSAFSTNYDVNLPDHSGNAALHLAASEGHLTVVEALLKAGANSILRDKHGTTPQTRARKKGHDQVADAVRDYGMPPLHVACLKGEVDKVKTLLEERSGVLRKKTDPNAKDPEFGNTPLCMASLGKHASVIKVLLEYSADPNIRCEDEQSPLSIASELGLVDVVKLMIARGADVNLGADNGLNPVHEAAEHNMPEVIELLAKAGANLNAAAVGGHGYTPLHIAAQLQSVEAMEALIKHGADINARDQSKETPMHKAAWHGKPESLEVLGKAKADFNAVCAAGHTAVRKAQIKQNRDSEHTIRTFSGDWGADGKKTPWSALMSASGFGGPHGEQAVLKLIKAGDDVNQATEDTGMTPLHLAAHLGHLGTVKLLIEHGADVKRADNKGYTPVHSAASENFQNVVAYLIEKGADPKAPAGDNGVTPLHVAAQKGHLLVKATLLEKGVDVNIPDKNSLPPLIYAVDKDQQGFVEALFLAGADFKLADSKGNTALHHACHRANKEMAEGLIRAGNPVDTKNAEGKTPMDLAMGHVQVTTSEGYLDAAEKYRAVVKLLELAAKGPLPPRAAEKEEVKSQDTEMLDPTVLTIKELRKAIEPFAASNKKVCKAFPFGSLLHAPCVCFPMMPARLHVDTFCSLGGSRR